MCSIVLYTKAASHKTMLHCIIQMITMMDISLRVLISLFMLFLSFFHALGIEVNVITSNTRDYTILSNHGITVTDRLLILKLRACHHAYVGLISGHTDTDQLYEIVFDGDFNKASFIREGKSYELPDVERIAGSVLHCNKYATFWITWNNYTIYVGSGLQTAGSLFLTWTSRNPLWPIQNIGIATAHGSTGEWTFYTPDKLQTTTRRMTDVSTHLSTTHVGSTSQSDRPPTSIPTTPLKLDKKTLSSYKRQHISASDSRKSSFYIGCVGVTVLILSVAFIAILDFVPTP